MDRYGPSESQIRLLKKVRGACGKVLGFARVDLHGGEWQTMKSCKRRGWLEAARLETESGTFVGWLYSVTAAGNGRLEEDKTGGA